MDGPTYDYPLYFFNGTGGQLCPTPFADNCDWFGYEADDACTFDGHIGTSLNFFIIYIDFVLGTCSFGATSVYGFTGTYQLVAQVGGVFSTALPVLIGAEGTSKR